MSIKPEIDPRNLTPTTHTRSEPEQVVDVLYQRMNGRWYAFSVIGEEVFVGSLTDDELASIRKEGPSKKSS